MRQFVVLGHDVPTRADEVALDDLPGSGRVDLFCRCATAALLRSHDVREDARVHLVFGDAYTVTIHGDSVRRLNPDERSTAALLRGALAEREEAIGHQPVTASPGVELRRRGVEATLDAACEDATPVLLHPSGDPAADVEQPDDPTFVLSDHRPFEGAEYDLIEERSAIAVSLGPRALHADQAITVAHNWLDTEGFESY